MTDPSPINLLDRSQHRSACEGVCECSTALDVIVAIVDAIACELGVSRVQALDELNLAIRSRI